MESHEVHWPPNGQGSSYGDESFAAFSIITDWLSLMLRFWAMTCPNVDTTVVRVAVLTCRRICLDSSNKLNKEQINDFESKLIDMYSCGSLLEHMHHTKLVYASLIRCQYFGDHPFASVVYICQTLTHDMHSHLFKSIQCSKNPQHDANSQTRLSSHVRSASTENTEHSTIGIWYVKCDATTPIRVHIFLGDVCASVRCRCHCILVCNSISAGDGTRKKKAELKKCTETTTGMELHRRSRQNPKNGK